MENDYTPKHWRKIRIEPNGEFFAVRTWYLGNPLGPVARKCLNVKADTEKLTHEEALQIGERLEDILSRKDK